MTYVGRHFALSQNPGSGVSCSEKGMLVDRIALLARTPNQPRFEEWQPRPAPDLNCELSACYGLPIPVLPSAHDAAATKRLIGLAQTFRRIANAHDDGTRALKCTDPAHESSSRGAACGRQKRRWSESVDADSRVLRLAEVRQRARGRFRCKNFSDARGVAVLTLRRAGKCAATALRARALANVLKRRMPQKPLFHRHLCAVWILARRISPSRVFCSGRGIGAGARASRAALGRASYAQKQLKSLLIFFCCSNPVSVPVDSRRHCTDVAIHSS